MSRDALGDDSWCDLDVDADLGRARGLPPRLYVEPAVLARERERVFARSWHVVARREQLAAIGAFVTADVAGEPVVVTHAEDGLRAFFNVCPHRAGPVARGSGRKKLLVCGYHGWTFSLDGKLARAPESEGCDLADVGLAPVSVATWGPLVFASIDPIAPLSEVLAGIPEPSRELAWVLRRDYELDAGWKVYVDNYLEGYHIPLVHPRLFGELDYPRYRTETSAWWSEQIAPLRALPAAEAGAPAPGTAPAETSSRVYRPDAEHDRARYHWVFPHLMLNAYFGVLQTNVVVPLGPHKTRVVFEWYATPPVPREGDARWDELVGFSELVQEEDRVICETVQKNLASRGAVRTRYVPARENGVHHFHRLYAAAMK